MRERERERERQTDRDERQGDREKVFSKKEGDKEERRQIATGIEQTHTKKNKKNEQLPTLQQRSIDRLRERGEEGGGSLFKERGRRGGKEMHSNRYGASVHTHQDKKKKKKKKKTNE